MYCFYINYKILCRVDRQSSVMDMEKTFLITPQSIEKTV